MLCRLSISNIAVIDMAEVEFSEGLNILTGETGAGKSIVIDAIGILLGQRSNRDLIRHGENKARVDAAFFVTDDTRELFDEFMDEDNMLIVSREFHTDGKNICTVNGKMVSVSVLRELGKNLINIFGQQDSHSLFNSSAHIGYVDKYCQEKLSDVMDEYRKVYDRANKLRNELCEIETNNKNKIERLENLEFWTDEIKAANLVAGEEDELRARRQIIKNHEKIYSLVSDAYWLLYEKDEHSACSSLGKSARDILDVCEYDASLSETAELINDAMYKTEEAARVLSGYIHSMNFDADELEQIEDRINLINTLKLKYGNTIEDILGRLEEYETEMSSIKTADDRKQNIVAELLEAEQKMLLLGKKIGEIRRGAAKQIEKEVVGELADLNMSGTKFEISIEETEANSQGLDKVEFLISTNPGEPVKPLAKIASGGEISRVCLALKSVLSNSDYAGTMIFDEIDSGVSGYAAQKIGEKLHVLSEKRQLICITHLPQIAAVADSHYLIYKDEGVAHFSTTINRLDHSGRVAELARIISGKQSGEQAVRAAEEMLEKR